MMTFKEIVALIKRRGESPENLPHNEAIIRELLVQPLLVYLDYNSETTADIAVDVITKADNAAYISLDYVVSINNTKAFFIKVVHPDTKIDVLLPEVLLCQKTMGIPLGILSDGLRYYLVLRQSDDDYSTLEIDLREQGPLVEQVIDLLSPDKFSLIQIADLMKSHSLVAE